MSIAVGVIEQFLNPGLTNMTRELIPGLFSGTGSLTRPSGPLPVDAVGIVCSFFIVPERYGRTFGEPLEWEPRMVQLAVIHTLKDGHEVVSEYRDMHSEALPFLWSVAYPTRVDYTIAPGVQVVFHWLLVPLF
jgi:hypothetical protein